MERTFVKIPNEMYDNLKLTNEEVTVLLLTYRNFQMYKNLSQCSLRLIAEDYMKYDTTNNRKILPKIREVITSLIKKEYIINLYDIDYETIFIEDIKDKNYNFYIEMKDLPEDNFFMVYDNDINSIFRSLKGTKLNKFNIIRYYIACCRVRSTEGKVGYLTQSKMKSLIDDCRTIGKYNTILQDDLHIIRYNNSFLTQEKHYESTFIGFYDDEKGFNERLADLVEERHLIHTDKITSNKRRSAKQKVNVVENQMDVNAENEELKRQLAVYKAEQEKLTYVAPVEEKENIVKPKHLGLTENKVIPIDNDKRTNEQIQAELTDLKEEYFHLGGEMQEKWERKYKDVNFLAQSRIESIDIIESLKRFYDKIGA